MDGKTFVNSIITKLREQQQVYEKKQLEKEIEFRENLPKKLTWDQYRVWDALKRPQQPIRPSTPKSLGEGVECPLCSSTNSHHIGVEIFDHAEDNNQGDHFTFWCKQSWGWDYLTNDNTYVEIPKDSFDNDCSKGYDRRGSIKIRCVCEGCGGMFKLIVLQHKGETIVEIAL